MNLTFLCSTWLWIPFSMGYMIFWWSSWLTSYSAFAHPSLLRSVVATEYPNEEASSSPQKMCCGTNRYTLSFFSSTTAPVWLARGAPATKVSSPRLIIPMAESTENPRRWGRKEKQRRKERRKCSGLISTVGFRGSPPLSSPCSAHLLTNEMWALSDYWFCA